MSSINESTLHDQLAAAVQQRVEILAQQHLRSMKYMFDTLPISSSVRADAELDHRELVREGLLLAYGLASACSTDLHATLVALDTLFGVPIPQHNQDVGASR